MEYIEEENEEKWNTQKEEKWNTQKEEKWNTEKEEKWNTEKEEKKKMKRRHEEDRGLGVCGLFVHACACPSECQPVTLRGWL